ncbi:hypothetical protein GGE09_001870 [Roseobacter sp. N2S]|nr:hypothetical protein [Roseobacter sp. N2S]
MITSKHKSTEPRRRFNDLPCAQQAGMLSNDDRFQRFAATRCGLPGQQFSPSATAQFLRDCCGITSRSQLNNERSAQNKFQALRSDFDAWRRRIANLRN